jgi:hypothetical protein
MSKQRVIKQLDKAWSSFKESFSGLTEKQMLEPGVMEGWSVKDILAHVSTWEEEAIKYLPYALEGRKPPRYKDMYGGIDAFNDRMTQQNKDLSLPEVLEKLDQTHDRLIAYIMETRESEFASEARFRRRLRLDTYSHYPIHDGAIRDWRNMKGYGFIKE